MIIVRAVTYGTNGAGSRMPMPAALADRHFGAADARGFGTQ